MKIIGVIILGFIFIPNISLSQGLEFVYAEKFDFDQVFYKNDPAFDGPLVMTSHLSDLSYFNEDVDPMGIKIGSLFFKIGDEFQYSGSFKGDSAVTILDLNINNGTDQQLFLLDVEGPCRLELGPDTISEFDFPELENMTGLVHFSDGNGQDSFWTSYMITEENSFQRIWNAGEKTLVTGAFKDSMIYVNPDGSEVYIEGKSEYNGYIISVDLEGRYEWSYVSEAIGLNFIRSVSVNNTTNEIVIAHDVIVSGKIIYLDFDGIESRDVTELGGISIYKIDFLPSGNMLMCGNYDFLSANTNVNLGGGVDFLDVADDIDAFLISYKSDGSIDWVQYITGDNIDTGVNFDFNENYIYMTGCIQKDGVFDEGGTNEVTYNSQGIEDAFIVKYDMDGNMKWANTFGGPSNDIGLDIKIEESALQIFGVYGQSIDVIPGDEEYVLTNENPAIELSNFYVEFNDLGALSTKENRFESVLRPNPANTYLSTSGLGERITGMRGVTGNYLKVFDADKIDVSDLPSGMYIVNLEKDGVVWSELVAVVH